MKNAFKAAALAGASVMGAMSMAGAAQAQQSPELSPYEDIKPVASANSRFDVTLNNAQCDLRGNTLTVKDARVDKIMYYGGDGPTAFKVGCTNGVHFTLNDTSGDLPNFGLKSKLNLTTEINSIERPGEAPTSARYKAPAVTAPKADCGSSNQASGGGQNIVGSSKGYTVQTSAGCSYKPYR